MSRPDVLLFDVNETLLDLSGLDPYFEATFGDASARREWFAALLQAAMVTTITGRYTAFTELGVACLDAPARRAGRQTGPADGERLLLELARLPAHRDAGPALAALHGGGFRLAVLTNNPPGLVRAQLRNAGLTRWFVAVLSADEVRRLKPAPEPYLHAADRLGVPVGGVMLVAAHGWDCAGALSAGARAAFVARPGQAPSPAGRAPELVVGGLAELPARLAG